MPNMTLTLTCVSRLRQETDGFSSPSAEQAEPKQQRRQMGCGEKKDSGTPPRSVLICLIPRFCVECSHQRVCQSCSWHLRPRLCWRCCTCLEHLVTLIVSTPNAATSKTCESCSRSFDTESGNLQNHSFSSGWCNEPMSSSNIANVDVFFARIVSWYSESSRTSTPLRLNRCSRFRV